MFYPMAIGGFNIIDSEGNIYVFGHQPDAIDYSTDIFNQVLLMSTWVANAWYLTKIIDKYGNDIYDLTYERGDYIAQFYRTIGQTTTSFSSGSWKSPSCSYSGGMDLNAVEGKLISPVYLKTISSNYNNLYINFNNQVSTELCYNASDISYKVGSVISAMYTLCPSPCNINPFYYLGSIQNEKQLILILFI